MKRATSILQAAAVLIALQGCGATDDDIDAGYVPPAEAVASQEGDQTEDATTTQAALVVVKCSSSEIKCDNRCFSKSSLRNGCNTCRARYVWRDAFANDQICVDSGERVNVQYENAFGPDNVDPACQANPSSCFYGRDQCKHGFVWRDAKPGDHVCVNPSARTASAEMNRKHKSRTIVWGTPNL